MIPCSSNKFHFAKIDTEGSELSALQSLFNDKRHPYVLEIEVSLFKRESSISSWDLISKIEEMGYELLDIRKNYSYKRIPVISPNSGKDFLKTLRGPNILPTAMGKISIIDGLFVRRDLDLSNVSSCLTIAYILCQYRQYNEGLWFISQSSDTSTTNLFYKWLTQHHEIISSIMKTNPAAAYGFHPYFNWLKHC